MEQEAAEGRKRFALKMPKPGIKLSVDRSRLIVAVIFVASLFAMLAWAIHAVDVYGGTFP